MKKILFITMLSLMMNSIYGQEGDTNFQQKKHEVKVNGLYLAAATAIDVSYEYVKNQGSGFGVSLLYNPREKGFPMSTFAVTPFYRVYFFSKKDYGANGIFVEGFLKMASVKKPNDLDYGNGHVNNNNKDYFSTALGISLGKKWINKSNFTLEIYAGVGRSLNENKSGIEALPRLGICIGKRF